MGCSGTALPPDELSSVLLVGTSVPSLVVTTSSLLGGVAVTSVVVTLVVLMISLDGPRAQNTHSYKCIIEAKFGCIKYIQLSYAL